MALLRNLSSMTHTCFDLDETEEMLQWLILQKANFIDTKSGTYAHYYDDARHMHWFHYLEEDMQDASSEWRLDLHIDLGEQATYAVSCDVAVEEFYATDEARFSPTVPVNLNLGELKLPLFVEMVNKNMMEKYVKRGENFDVNMNFSVLDIQMFPNRDEWKAQATANGEETPPELMMLGVMVEHMVSEGEEPPEEMVSLFKHIAEDLRVNPLEIVSLMGTVKEVKEFSIGNGLSIYNVTLTNELGDFYLPLPETFLEVDDIEPGVFLSTLGFFSALYLNKAEERKENVIPFNVVH